MTTTIHAYSAYSVDPESGYASDTIEYRWFTGEFAETAALNGYHTILKAMEGDEQAAVSLYRIELSDAERDALNAWRVEQYGPDDEYTQIDEAMDVIEWDRDWLHPAVTVIEQTPVAAKRRQWVAENFPQYTQPLMKEVSA